MKHYSDYKEDWSFATRMSQIYHNHISEDKYRHGALSSWEIASCPLFYMPCDYALWFNQSYGKHRKVYPVCYLVALDDIIPIKIDPNPIVLLQNPEEMSYVWKRHCDVIDMALRIIGDCWEQAYKHWNGEMSNFDIMYHVSTISNDGWKYYPDFLKHHICSKGSHTIEND